MKRIAIVFLVILTAVLADLGCVALFEKPLFAIKDQSDSVHQKYYGLLYDVVDCFDSETMILTKGSKYACPVSEVTTVLPAVMVNNELYYWTSTSHNIAKCGVMDGKITSSVQSDQLPYKNNQSNFGKGIEYQLGAEGTIEIFQDGVWRIYAQKNKLDMYFKSYEDYQSIYDINCDDNVNCSVLVKFNGTLYAQSNVLLDYDVLFGDGKPVGTIDELIPTFYVPKEDGQTNQSYLLGATVVECNEKSMILYYENVYHLYERIDQ